MHNYMIPSTLSLSLSTLCLPPIAYKYTSSARTVIRVGGAQVPRRLGTRVAVVAVFGAHGKTNLLYIYILYYTIYTIGTRRAYGTFVQHQPVRSFGDVVFVIYMQSVVMR